MAIMRANETNNTAYFSQKGEDGWATKNTVGKNTDKSISILKPQN